MIASPNDHIVTIALSLPWKAVALAPRPRELQHFWVWWDRRLENRYRGGRGRSASATVGVRVGIHETEGISTLLDLT